MSLLGLILIVVAIVVCGAVAYRADRLRAGDAVVCVRCDYELLPQMSECPECGNDVSTPRGRAIGHRAGRRGIAVAAFLAIALLVFYAMTSPLIAAASNDARKLWYRTRSDASLIRAMDDPEVGHLAEAVLYDRVTSILPLLQPLAIGPAIKRPAPELRQELAPDKRERIVAFAETLYAGGGTRRTLLDTWVSAAVATRRFTPAERDRIFDAMIKGLSGPSGANLDPSFIHALFRTEASAGFITPEQFERYFRAFLVPKLELGKSNAVPGELVDARIVLTAPFRFSPRVQMMIVVHPTSPSGLKVFGPDLSPAVPRMTSLARSPQLVLNRSGTTCFIAAPDTPGRHPISLTLDVSIYNFSEIYSAPEAINYPDPARIGPIDRPKIRFSIELPAMLEVTLATPPPDLNVRTDRPIANPVTAFRPTVWQSPSTGDLHVTLIADPQPIAIAADVLLRQEGRETLIGWVYIPAGRPFTAQTSAKNIHFPPSEFDIILRPNAAPLEGLRGIGDVQGLPITIPARLWISSPSDWEPPSDTR